MSGPGQDAAHTNTRPTILVTDDAPEYLMLLGEILSPHYNVRIAGNGASAIELASNAPQPSLILLDVEMPGMDGYETLRRLREQATTRDIPVIFVTGNNDTNDELHGLELGAVDYITKPPRPAILLARGFNLIMNQTLFARMLRNLHVALVLLLVVLSAAGLGMLLEMAAGIGCGPVARPGVEAGGEGVEGSGMSDLYFPFGGISPDHDPDLIHQVK